MFLIALQSNIPHANIARYCFSIIIKTFASRINPRTYTQIHTPTVVQGTAGVDGNPP